MFYSLLLVLAAVAVPGPECQTQCGGVEIQYPFGIGDSCSRAVAFNVSCLQVQDGAYKPFLALGVFELLNISLIDSTIRETNHISMYCYNSSSGFMESSTWSFDVSKSPFRFSDVHNKFTVIGCNTLAYIYDSAGKGYQSGCVSTCQNLTDLAEGSCSGLGCCQTAIPRGMGFYNVSFDGGFDTSQIWRFGRCSYAISMSAITARALQEGFVTTRKEGTGVLVKQDGNFPIKAIHATLILA
ncbi:hypothetical protein HU200_031595 [Digitaria exilis]|uniref:Wall-associated receptor kinase galacturonan-binding domain-containing protein n=1 Tax=Digitaria exilis TaxID=1010633 RepID=A0A835BMA2_9POAL|nr:hypothetical protein HU200_031595 [Digitaria exilis]